jgi:hypothetical protein
LEILGPEPADPDDGSFAPRPNGQLQQWSYEGENTRSQPFRARRRFTLSVAPLYAVFRWPATGTADDAYKRFIGRGTTRLRGGGALVELDVQLLRFLWGRIQASYSAHPVEDIADVDDDDVLTPVARAGIISASYVGGGLAYALDLGRVLPLIDGGMGVMMINSPEAVQAGQNGGECVEGGICEPGLRCGALELCEPVPQMVVNAGIGVDYLLGEHWSVGVHVRYFALLANPAVFPVYYTGALRLGARF